MLMTTTSSLDGRPVRQYLGVVNGEAIIGANLFKDMFASIRNVVGGRAGSYERTLADARRIAMGEMQEEAQKLGANAAVHSEPTHHLADVGSTRLAQLAQSVCKADLGGEKAVVRILDHLGAPPIGH